MATVKGNESVGVYTITMPNIYVSSVEDKDPSGLPGSPPGTSTTHLHQPENDTGEEMGCSRPNLNVYVNTFIFLIMATLIALCEYGFIPHTKNGFYCGDPKISFPFQDDTATATLLFVGVLAVPIFIIWILETILYQPDDYSIKNRRFVDSSKITLLWYCHYILGVVLNLTIVEIAKCLMGEHRPHFLHTCSPDTGFNCTKGEYVRDFKCTNIHKQSEWNVLDSSKSFPSGHTSMSVHMALFTFWYLQQRMRHLGKVEPYMLTLFLQCLGITFALFASITRITDHRHHWWDVLIGFFVGVATAIYTVRMLSKSFIAVNPSLSRDSMSNSDICGDRATTHPSVRRLLSAPSYTKEVSLE